MDDDNIFDKDDALDFMIYEKMEGSENRRPGKGCLSMIVFLALVPLAGCYMALSF